MLMDIMKKIDESDYILIGIGMDFCGVHNKEEQMAAYQKLSKVVAGKSYFVVTLKTDDIIYETDFKKDRIVAPCGSDKTGNVVQNNDYDESAYLPQWEVYKKWLQNTLNKKLLILELGVGFQFPTVVRWPFEKIAYFNLKSDFVRIHNEFAQLTSEIKERSISVNRDPINFLIDYIK